MDNIQTFDTLFTTNHIQMLKLLLPYLPPDARCSLAVTIKAAELRYTLDFLSAHPYALHYTPCSDSPDTPPGPDSLLQSLLPFCTAWEREKMQNMQNLFRNMENMQEMMQIITTFQEIMPEFAPDDLLNGLSGEGGMPDLTQIIELLGHNGNNHQQP